MKKKVAIAILCSLIMAFVPCMPAAAETPPVDQVQSVQPRWAYLDSIRLTLTKVSGGAACSVRMEANSSSIKANMELIQIDANGSETTVETWKASGKDTLRWGDTVSVKAGFTYRLTVSAVITGNDGRTENIYDEYEKEF